MGQAKSFIEVLQDQIREDLRLEIREEMAAELAAEIRAQESKFSNSPNSKGKEFTSTSELSATWLAANVEKSFFRPLKLANQAYRQTSNKKTRQTSNIPHDVKPLPKPFQNRSDNVIEFLQINLKENQQEGHKESLRKAVKPEEVCALELIARHSGFNFDTLFSKVDLKKAWRIAALKTHPDRHAELNPSRKANQGVVFGELAQAYETLAQLFTR